jgi:formiminotetrahydrofolate cyclodeaminase
MQQRLDALQIPAKFGSDLAVAKALAIAARTGVLENVKINLDSIQDEPFKISVKSRLQAIETEPRP